MGYSEPQAGSDAANMQLKAGEGRGQGLEAERPEDLGPPRLTSPTGTGSALAPTRTSRSTRASASSCCPWMPRASRSSSMPTIGKEITNQVFFNDVFVDDEYMVGEQGKGFRYIAEALDLERFTMFTFSPIEERTRAPLRVRAQRRTGTASPCANDPVVRQTDRPARDPDRGGARARPQVRRRVDEGRQAPDQRGVGVQALRHTALQRSRTSPSTSWAPRGSCASTPRTRRSKGRFEGTYRCTVWRPSAAAPRRSRRTSSPGRKLGLPEELLEP